MSCQSTLSCDSLATTVVSPLSVQTFDDTVDADTDRRPDSAFSSREHCFSLRSNDSYCRLDDKHISSDADINLHEAHQQILELQPHLDKLLMMEVYGKLYLPLFM